MLYRTCVLIAGFASFVQAIGCAQNTTVKDQQTVSLAKAYKEVSEGKAFLVDVRSEREWKAGHLAAATHIPIDEVVADKDGTGQISEMENVSKSTPIYLHCAKGARAVKAAKHLRALGFAAIALKCDYADIEMAGFEAAAHE